MKKAVELLDLTGIPCPMNTAHALLKLAQMPDDACLEIVLDDGEPIINVPVSLEDEGCHILARERKGKQWMLRVQK